jgi:hypothetical protein
MKNPLSAMLFGGLLVVIVYLASCQAPYQTPQKNDSLPSKSASAKAFSSPLNSPFADYLYADSSIFTNLRGKDNKKITFRFFIADIDTLTLRAWVNDSARNNYPGIDTNFAFQLANGAKSGIEFGKGTYFGNLVLYNKEIQKIIHLIRANKAKFVVFTPRDPTGNGGQLLYDVIATNANPLSFTDADKQNSFANGVVTNPSPPKNSNQ